MSLPQRHQPPSTAMPAALLVEEKAIRDGRDPWDLCFAKRGLGPVVHVCTHLAD